MSVSFEVMVCKWLKSTPLKHNLIFNDEKDVLITWGLILYNFGKSPDCWRDNDMSFRIKLNIVSPEKFR